MLHLGLLGFIPLGVHFFGRFRPERAALLLMFAAMLFMPERFNYDAPLIPPIDKRSLPYLLLTALLFFKAPKKLKNMKLGRGPDVFLFLMMAAGFMTVQTNQDALIYGTAVQTYLPALKPKDAITFIAIDLFNCAMPFVLGRILLKTERDAKEFLKVFATFGLIYAGFCLIEVRLSPNVHNWTYGFPPHYDFMQTRRWGGWRPQVYMAHGLACSLFMCNAMLATVHLAKHEKKLRMLKSLPVKFASGIMFVLLILCKSTGAIVYGLIMVPVLMFTSAKTRVRMVFAFALFIGIYPMSRSLDFFPTEDLLVFATKFNRDRAASMDFRFRNEDMLGDKARQRILWGWGGYHRNAVFDDFWGKAISVADGWWISSFGQRGVAGMATGLAILLSPLMVGFFNFKKIKNKKSREHFSTIMVIHMLYTLDLLPNGLFTNFPFFTAGIVYGLATALPKEKPPPPPAMQPGFYPGYPAGYPQPVAPYPPPVGPSGPPAP